MPKGDLLRFLEDNSITVGAFDLVKSTVNELAEDRFDGNVEAARAFKQNVVGMITSENELKLPEGIDLPIEEVYPISKLAARHPRLHKRALAKFSQAKVYCFLAVDYNRGTNDVVVALMTDPKFAQYIESDG